MGWRELMTRYSHLSEENARQNSDRNWSAFKGNAAQRRSGH